MVQSIVGWEPSKILSGTCRAVLDWRGREFALQGDRVLKDGWTVKISELDTLLTSTVELILSQDTQDCFRLTVAFYPLYQHEGSLQSSSFSYTEGSMRKFTPQSKISIHELDGESRVAYKSCEMVSEPTNESKLIYSLFGSPCWKVLNSKKQLRNHFLRPPANGAVYALGAKRLDIGIENLRPQKMREANSKLSGKDRNSNRGTSNWRFASFNLIRSESLKSKQRKRETPSFVDHLFRL